MNFSLNEVHMTLRKALCGRGLAFGVVGDFVAVGAWLSSGRANDGVGTVLRHDNDALIALLHRVETALSLNPTSASFVEPLEQTLAEHLGGTPFPRERACAISEQRCDESAKFDILCVFFNVWLCFANASFRIFRASSSETPCFSIK